MYWTLLKALVEVVDKQKSSSNGTYSSLQGA